MYLEARVYTYLYDVHVYPYALIHSYYFKLLGKKSTYQKQFHETAVLCMR